MTGRSRRPPAARPPGASAGERRRQRLAGTDWIEDFMLRQAGPDKYASGIRASSAGPRRSQDRFQSFGANRDRPHDGQRRPNSELTLNFGNGGDQLFRPAGLLPAPPGQLHHRLLHHEHEGDQAGRRLQLLRLPRHQPGLLRLGRGAGDLFGHVQGHAAGAGADEVPRHPEAQAIWVLRGGALSPNKRVPLSAYPTRSRKAPARS